MPFSYVSEGSSASSTPKKSTFSPEGAYLRTQKSSPSDSKVLSFDLEKPLLLKLNSAPLKVRMRCLTI